MKKFRLSRFIFIIFILAMFWPLTSAGFLYVLSDGACPAGTTDSGQVEHKVQSSTQIQTETGLNWYGSPHRWCTGAGGQYTDLVPIGFRQLCYEDSTVGFSKKCVKLIGQQLVDIGGAWHGLCWWETITYSTFRLCKWNLP